MTLELCPEPLPAGSALRDEGIRAAHAIVPDRTPFHERYNVPSEVARKTAQAATDRPTWNMIMGLATVDDQVAGLRELEDFGRSTGVVIDRGLVIPNWVTGLPAASRAQAPRGTSFILDGYEDHRRIAQASTIMPCFNDWHIGSPAAFENTLDAIHAGGEAHGVLSQFTWTLPYADDDVALVTANVRAIGAVAAHRTRMHVVDSYLDDGLPSQFVDMISWVGYALLEHHVVTTLCGARYSTGFGQLVADLPTKCALWLALTDVLAADHPAVSYVYGNTLDAVEEPAVGNFSITAAEVIAFTAVEAVHRTGTAIMPNPATEKVRVPTVQEIADVHAVARAAAAKGQDLGRLLDLSAIYPLRDQLVDGGRLFFRAALTLLAERGVDTNDPLQVLLGLRRLGASELERTCHPGERFEDGAIVPRVPNEISQRASGLVERELQEIAARGHSQLARGRRFLVASGDAHSYALDVLVRTLRRLGADVIEAGVDVDPEQLVAAASEHQWPEIAVSTHNGQCVGYVERLMRLLPVGARVYVGGRLNHLEDGAEPVDATERLRQLGAMPCVAVADILAIG